MKKPLLAIAISILACFGICSQVSATYTAGSTKLSAGDMAMKSRNNSLYYDPSECNSFSTGSGCCNYKPTTDVWQDRLREFVEACGEYTMGLQEKYGLPWEIVYGQMVMESHVGTAYSQEQQDKNNYLGMRYADSQYYSIANSTFGGSATMGAYETLGDMIASWNVDFLRNGLYDHAFSHLDPNNYSMKDFFYAYKETYCPSSDGCGPADTYWAGIQQGLDIVNEVAAKKGWPSSAQLAKQKHIPIGGEYPVKGNIHNQIDASPHSLHADCSGNTSTNNSFSTSTSSDANSSISGDQITWIGDSYSCGALPIIKAKFPGISFGGSECDANSYIMSNKGVSDRYGGGSANPPALTILKRITDANELKPYLVMAIGTNMGWDDNEVNEFKNIMSSHPDTKVIFVNVKAKAHLGADDLNTNNRLKNLVSSNDNYYLADWATAYDDKYFATNDTHPTANGGYDKWVEVIYDAINNAKGEGCTTYEGEYPQYYQGDQSSDWYNKPYAGGTIGSSGCGPSSLAMLATVATGTDIYPHDIAAMTNGSGWGKNYVHSIGSSMVNLDKQVGLKYGFEVIEVKYDSLDDAIIKMRQYLKDGYMLHLSGQGSDPFSMAGHYIGIFDIDDSDTVTLANSSHHGDNKRKLKDVVYAGMHGGAFSAIRGKGGSKCGGFCQTGGGDYSGGFKSVEEAEKVVIAPYQALRLTPNQWGKYHITAGTTENCFSFTNYFISKYLKMDDFIGVPGVDGGGLAQQFYNMYHGKYPDLEISNKPSAFAVASCGDKYYSGSNYSHTFVILGVDQANDKMIIGEAGYGMGASFTGAKEKSLTSSSDSAYNGTGSISCTYVNVNKYITGL